MSLRVLAFMAHPDDVEFTCAGTLARLQKEAGAQITIATMTSGDCGSISHGPAQIAAIRHQEAKAAAAVIGADYFCAGLKDLFVMYDEPSLRSVVEVVRKARPDLVIGQPPADYMIDHETSSRLVRTACFAAPAPNFLTYAIEPAQPIAKVPHLYYVTPLDGVDLYGNHIAPQFVVDISTVIEAKEKMLAAHASQREWLRAHHHMDEYIEQMKRGSAAYGKHIGAAYGEGYNQHLGHGYPHDNAIGQLLKIK